MSYEKEISTKLVFAGSVVLAILIASSTIYAIYTPNFYALETKNWAIQSIAQDIFDLFVVVPFLIISALLVYKQSKTALLLWGGILLYLIYSYIIYCFSVHFNSLFLVYCGILCISFYLFLYFILSQFTNPVIKEFTTFLWVKSTAIYFIFISVAFFFLWLSDIIPAIHNHKLPAALAETGLPTNAVHVIDLAGLLPGTFITAILLFRKKSLGFVMAPILLSFFIFMSASIAVISILLTQEGLAQGYQVPVIMGILTTISCLFLILFLKNRFSSINITN